MGATDHGTGTGSGIRGMLTVLLPICALLAAPTLAETPASARSASGQIGLSLTISPRPGIRTTALCTETTRGSALLRVTDASGGDLPPCGAPPREQIGEQVGEQAGEAKGEIVSRNRREEREPGVRTLLVAPV